MKFVTVKDLKTSPEIWKVLPSEREMIITNNGKPIALLSPLNDEMMDDTVLAVRKAKALNAVKKMQDISASLGNNKLSVEEINTIINVVRGKNKK